MREHPQGIATVRFAIGRCGTATNCSQVKGSGRAIIDGEVMTLIRRVTPFPEFPPETPEPAMTLTAPIQFRIR
ncbi:MAG: energy transducer TonB [Deltaproteobacteria bacterium]|jgi:TonB family protein|nr:energy transducer TonB [Deltaproteobacteria bacterium]